MPSIEELPKPARVTGGCLCGAVRFRVDFPRGYDFVKNTGTCQCTQCRRNSGSVFWSCVQVPKVCLRWGKVDEKNTSASQIEEWTHERPPSALRSFSATPGIRRGFCATCGGFLTWMKDEGSLVHVSVGTIDPVYLVGPSDDPEVAKTDVDGEEVPKGGYGPILAGGYGRNLWCSNEIKGVTDDLAAVGVGRGKRSSQND
ncbi:hypothetical protein LA080_009835 [Diaporthe eres]|uniref:CENP-V/GFA domain-containing protein n=1 Tax=Diaporthe vaccinii TaxID=105482 RepID=A0ABR4DRH3_9PEZI|nr:hypothetical protein LA080_009835 [Diaporthe eres]